ncbi:MAG: hypothetical protein M1826_003466 [Phylliscum demangeonii]|nr:MAG: hypothetical protein M1826_003466 [Phylliscum demangeonii]
MCQTINWKMTVCGHVSTFKPFGDCKDPARDETCHELLWRTKTRGLCRECLAAHALASLPQLVDSLEKCQAYEHHQRRLARQQQSESEPPSDATDFELDEANERRQRRFTRRIARQQHSEYEWPSDAAGSDWDDHHPSDNAPKTESEYLAHRRIAIALCTSLLEFAVRFNSARDRWVDNLQKFGDDKRYAGYKGYLRFPLGGSDGIPPLAPEMMYREWLCYLRQSPIRLAGIWIAPPVPVGMW